MIAPFWADVDTRGSGTPPAGVAKEDVGKVWYREEFSSELLEKAGQEIREAFIDASDFVPTSLFIATWRNVGYYEKRIDKARRLKARTCHILIFSYYFALSSTHSNVSW